MTNNSIDRAGFSRNIMYLPAKIRENNCAFHPDPRTSTCNYCDLVWGLVGISCILRWNSLFGKGSFDLIARGSKESKLRMLVR
mmetsp:Transcript_23644/g.63814  ORF Transcript_23644/g.63814 Transcript_23644/m.63814 type:complete len:83 (-) Transcript_23644:39-287(-)